MPKFVQRSVLAAALALPFLLFPHHASAQSGDSQLSCVNKTRDNSNNLVLSNSCNFTIHVYWAEGDRAWNTYLTSGQSWNTYQTGRYSFYACASPYFVVGPDGRVIQSEVSYFSCKKP